MFAPQGCQGSASSMSGAVLLQSTLSVAVELLVVQVLEGGPVAEGQLRHLKFVNERKSK
jgi:hypothetical protein